MGVQRGETQRGDTASDDTGDRDDYICLMTPHLCTDPVTFDDLFIYLSRRDGYNLCKITKKNPIGARLGIKKVSSFLFV